MKEAMSEIRPSAMREVSVVAKWNRPNLMAYLPCACSLLFTDYVGST